MNEEIKNELKNEALALAEGISAEAIQHVFSFEKKALEKSDNTLLIAIVPILSKVEEYLLSLADKIDGIEGNIEGAN